MVNNTGPLKPGVSNVHVDSVPKEVTDVSVDKSMVKEIDVAEKWISVSGNHDEENIDGAVGFVASNVAPRLSLLKEVNVANNDPCAADFEYLGRVLSHRRSCLLDEDHLIVPAVGRGEACHHGGHLILKEPGACFVPDPNPDLASPVLVVAGGKFDGGS